MNNQVSILVAYCQKNRVIGNNNSLPWERLEGDLPRFKALTSSQIVIMGRKTWESIPVTSDGKCWLPNRENIVISRNINLHEYHNHRSAPLRFFDCLEDALSHCQWISKQIYIIGGEQLYKQVLEIDIADKIIASEVYQDYPGDAFFPELNNSWNRILLSSHRDYDLVSYQRPGFSG